MTAVGAGAHDPAVGVRRRDADANPSQVWRLPAQHQPTLGASLFAGLSRPVPLLIQMA